MWTKRILAVAFVITLPLVMTSAGCKDNPAATAKCNAEKDADTCQTCCTKNGASGYKYVGACSCLGG